MNATQRIEIRFKVTGFRVCKIVFFPHTSYVCRHIFGVIDLILDRQIRAVAIRAIERLKSLGDDC